MLIRIIFLLIISALISCNQEKKPESEVIPLEGTWQLISGTIIEQGDTTVTDYTKDQRMIKLINKTHFAFLNHDLHKGKDSTAVFVAGGGEYELKGDQYIEHLAYCNFREWEGNDFQFTVTVKNDTLVQSGIEKIEGIGVDRMNVERYVRINN
jgi:hypothetical protein